MTAMTNPLNVLIAIVGLPAAIVSRMKREHARRRDLIARGMCVDCGSGPADGSYSLCYECALINMSVP